MQYTASEYFTKVLKPLLLEQYKGKPKFQALAGMNALETDKILSEFYDEFFTQGMGWDPWNMPRSRLVAMGRWMGYPFYPEQTTYGQWRTSFLQWLQTYGLGGGWPTLLKRLAVLTNSHDVRGWNATGGNVILMWSNNALLGSNKDYAEKVIATILPAGVGFWREGEGGTDEDGNDIIIFNVIAKHDDTLIRKWKPHRNGNPVFIVRRSRNNVLPTVILTFEFIITDASTGALIPNATIEITMIGAIPIEPPEVVSGNIYTNAAENRSKQHFYRVSAPGYSTVNGRFTANNSLIIRVALDQPGIMIQAKVTANNPRRVGNLDDNLQITLFNSQGVAVSQYPITSVFSNIEVQPGESYSYTVTDLLNRFEGTMGNFTANAGTQLTIPLQWNEGTATLRITQQNGRLAPNASVVLTEISTNVSHNFSSINGQIEITIKDYVNYTLVLNAEGQQERTIGVALLEVGQTYTYMLTEQEHEIITDPDGEEYNAVKIGNYFWTTVNMNFAGPLNGHEVGVPYDNNPVNGERWGRLYTRAEALEIAAAIALVYPGYHVPTVAEMADLRDYSNITNPGNPAQGLKQIGMWPSGDGTETNSTGFSALPAGYWQSTFQQGGMTGFFWTSDQQSPYVATAMQLTGGGIIEWNPNMGVEARCSLRLVRDY